MLLRDLTLGFEPEESGTASVALGEGYYRTSIRESNDAVEMSLTAETMLYQSNEHYIDSYYGDFWVDWRNEQVG